jgi:hypothetical protein
MKKIIRLTESDLARIVRRVIKEETEMTKMFEQEKEWLQEKGWKLIDSEKYKLYAEKEDNTTTTIPLNLIITSQSDGTLHLSVYNKNKINQLLNDGTLNTNSETNFLKSIEDIIFSQ